MRSIEPWCSEMQEFAKGRASLSNIIYDCTYGRLPVTVIRRFLRQIISYWNNRDILSFNSPEKLITRVVEGGPTRFFCKGPKILSGPKTCSRIMNAQDFLINNVERRLIPFALSDRPTDSQLIMMEHLGLQNATRGNMETRRPYAWITQTEKLNKLKKRHPNSTSYASTVKNVLGLQHFQEDEQIIEIQYPKEFMSKESIYAPTFLEGCPSLIYMSKKKSDGWGRAINLQTLREGFPEAVHSTIRFTPDFSVKFLGRLSPSKASNDWNKFLARMPIHWSPFMMEQLDNYV
jgi:hypothetical protein